MAFQWLLGVLGAVYTFLISPLFGNTSCRESSRGSSIRFSEVVVDDHHGGTNDNKTNVTNVDDANSGGRPGGGGRRTTSSSSGGSNGSSHHHHRRRGPKLFLLSAWDMLTDVLSFWRNKMISHYSRPTPLSANLHALHNATTFEQWEEAALNLDTLLGLDLWRNNPVSGHYDFKLINERLASIEIARETGDVHSLVNLLRSGLVRNLGNITATKLYNRAFAGTKFLIEEYVRSVAEGVEDIGSLPSPGQTPAGGGLVVVDSRGVSRGGGTRQVVASTPGGGSGRGGVHHHEHGHGHGHGHHVSFEDNNNGNVSTTSSGGSVGGGSSSRESSRRRQTLSLAAAARSGSATAGGTPKDLRSTTIASPSSHLSDGGRMIATMSTQAKLDFIHDTRQAFGRTALVLQGGAIFGLCHLGVVKALFLRGLLPRIIVGTATGALIAALVAVHSEEELPRVLKGDGIDLSAFAKQGQDPVKHNEGLRESMWSRWATLVQRVQRSRREGYFLDVEVLEECIKSNIGDLTFEEAYRRSKRVLNITVATAGHGGVPTLLNYLTAPNVLIWTAAVASNASTPTFYGHRQTRILCKDPQGDIVPWKPANTVDFNHWTNASYTEQESPLLRIAELFNVNHFIVSQARPYLIPFLQSDMHGPSMVETRNKTMSGMAFVMRMVGLELRHRLRQLDTLQLLPAGIRRFLVDERVPGASMMLVPEVTAGDFVRLMETPTKETLEYWILRGERSVWPAVAALKIRCAIEEELDRAYQVARRLRAGGLRRKTSHMQTPMLVNLESPDWAEKERKERFRAHSRAHSAGARCLATA
ncbi:putative lipase [Triangularia setosa]|uniref:Patatin-like phospholipase domain-containing protein n=1 Tax=Triangularia setosa TaxID=2587417 RepID=A0AAN6W4I9_9PEZI|nr:putative lipase [Podospora setosa]